MLEPVMDLELDPRCSKQVQTRCRDEASGLPWQEPLTNQSRVRGPKLVLVWLLGVFPWKIPSETLAWAAHEWQFHRIKLAIRVPCIDEPFIFQWMVNCVSLRVAGRIPIVEVVRTQLNAQKVEVECAKKAWQPVPRHEYVNQLENLDKEALEQCRLEAGWLHCFRVARSLRRIIGKNQLWVILKEDQAWGLWKTGDVLNNN